LEPGFFRRETAGNPFGKTTNVSGDHLVELVFVEMSEKPGTLPQG